MLVKICTDIWRDVFDWLSLKDRRRLALKFNEVKDREFSDLCQKWLHEWTKNVCLEKLLIDGNWDTKLARLLNREQKDEVPFAEVEMPANINDFERIRIRYLNTSALNFLRQLQPLFRGVNLHVYFYEKSLEATRTALTDLMPLFSGDGIEFLVLLSSSMLPTIRDNFQAQFLGIKILSMYGHAAGIDEFAEFYLPWLSTRRADGQPRTLAMRYDDTSIMEITDRIRQDFLNPTSGPISFFIRLHLWNWNTNPSFSGITESITKNASGEQLMVYHDVDILLIGRCPAEVNGQTWIVEMERKLEEANDSKKRTITIAYPMIGQIEEAQQQMDENELKENGEEEDADQPGPSNRF